MTVIEAKNIQLHYGKSVIIQDASLCIEKGDIVSIIGPNGSGKSTLLKGLSRLKKPSRGKTLLDGQDIWSQSTKEVAKKIAILPQVKYASSDIRVRDLVGFGRFPHLKFGSHMTKEDEDIIDEALRVTRLRDYEQRYVGNLSGGEQQRAWIAMALAQVPQILILDEPTTFLDISHQLEIMETIRELNQEKGMTIIMVLHDVNQAVRFSHKICAIKDGEVAAYENSNQMITREIIRTLFEIDGAIYEDSQHNCPFFIPSRSTQERGRS